MLLFWRSKWARKISEKSKDLESMKQQGSMQEEEIDLNELFMVVWDAKWIVLSVTLLSTIISAIYALSLPNIYRAEVLLAPASVEESGGINNIASQYGGLASLAGINLGGLGGGVDRTLFGIEVLRSRKFIGEFVERHNILVPLMASKGWELSEDRLIYDRDIYLEESSEWVRKAGSLRQSKPSYIEAHEKFTEMFSVVPYEDVGLVMITVEHFSPYVAKQWLDWMVEDINIEIKQQDIDEAEKSIEYLREQLEASPFSELQAIFYQLIEEQIKTIMLANARPEYLFRTIDPAVVAEEKSGPKRALICIVGLTLGGVISVLWSLVRYYLVGDKRLRVQPES